MTLLNLNKAGLTVTPLLVSVQVGTGDTTVYTVPASHAAMISTLTLTNAGTVPVHVSLSVVPSGGSVDGTHKFVASQALDAGESLLITDIAGQWQSEGTFVSVNADVAASVNVAMSYLDFA